jgi:hypothetical protein
MPRILAVATLFALRTAVAHADNWPAWRGPTGQGLCFEKNLPVTWSATDNVKWKVPLAAAGNSTPVIWTDRIFLTEANKGGTVRSLLCFARADGKLLWKQNVQHTRAEQNWGGITYTNASAAVDDRRVVACFASAGLYDMPRTLIPRVIARLQPISVRALWVQCAPVEVPVSEIPRREGVASKSATASVRIQGTKHG